MHRRLTALSAMLVACAASTGFAAESGTSGAPSAPGGVPSAPGAPSASPGEPSAPATAATTESRPALQMSSDFGSPTLAIGSYRPVGDVESRGVRVAPFTIRAAAIAGIGYDNNVALAPVNKTSSTFLSFAPSIVAGLEGALHRYYAVYRGNYGRYTSSSIDNYDDHNLSLTAADSWTSRFRSTLAYDFLRGHNPRGYSVAAVQSPDRWDWHSLRGTASYGSEGAQGRLEGVAGVSSRKYLTNRTANAQRDYDQIELGGGFSYRLAPRTRALIQVTHYDITHDSDPTLDSTEMRYVVGLAWEALAKTRGTVKVGLVNKDFSDPQRADFTGPTYEATVQYQPKSYSTVNLTVRRIVAENAEAGSTFTVANGVVVNWDHDWTERWKSSLSGLREVQSLRGQDRDDTYSALSLRGSYAVRPWLRLAAEVRRDMRSSTLAGIEYKRTLTLFSIQSAL